MKKGGIVCGQKQMQILFYYRFAQKIKKKSIVSDQGYYIYIM